MCEKSMRRQSTILPNESHRATSCACCTFAFASQVLLLTIWARLPYLWLRGQGGVHLLACQSFELQDAILEAPPSPCGGSRCELAGHASRICRFVGQDCALATYGLLAHRGVRLGGRRERGPYQFHAEPSCVMVPAVPPLPPIGFLRSACTGLFAQSSGSLHVVA